MCLSNSQDDDSMPRCVCRTHKMMIAWCCVCQTHKMMMCLSNSQDDDSMLRCVCLTHNLSHKMIAWWCVCRTHKMMIAWWCVCRTHKMMIACPMFVCRCGCRAHMLMIYCWCVCRTHMLMITCRCVWQTLSVEVAVDSVNGMANKNRAISHPLLNEGTCIREYSTIRLLSNRHRNDSKEMCSIGLNFEYSRIRIPSLSSRCEIARFLFATWCRTQKMIEWLIACWCSHAYVSLKPTCWW